MGDGIRIRVHERTVLSDAWARLERVRFDYLRSDGQWQEQVREIYQRGHGAAILLYELSRRSIVLVKQFRFPVYEEEFETGLGDGFLLEVPAGVLEVGGPESTIQAEVIEETGFVIGKPEFLYSAYVSPGSVTERIHYFTAPYDAEKRQGEGGGLQDEGEDIEVVEMSIDDALNAVSTGQIRDAKTIMLLQFAALRIFDKA